MLSSPPGQSSQRRRQRENIMNTERANKDSNKSKKRRPLKEIRLIKSTSSFKCLSPHFVSTHLNIKLNKDIEILAIGLVLNSIGSLGEKTTTQTHNQHIQISLVSPDLWRGTMESGLCQKHQTKIKRRENISHLSKNKNVISKVELITCKQMIYVNV